MFHQLQGSVVPARKGRDPRVSVFDLICMVCYILRHHVPQIPATRGDLCRGRLTTNNGIYYKIEEGNQKFVTLNPDELDAEKDEWQRTARFVSSRDHMQTEKRKMVLKPPRHEALQRRQTKLKFRRKDIEAEEEKNTKENIVTSLTSASVLTIVSEMEEKFKTNIRLIDQISAENVEMESRIKELERALQEKNNGFT